MNVNGLEITNIEITKYPTDGNSDIVGSASITLNDCLAIRGLRIKKVSSGLIVGYPVNPFYKGDDFITLVSPLTKQLRDVIESEVLAKYAESQG